MTAEVKSLNDFLAILLVGAALGVVLFLFDRYLMPSLGAVPMTTGGVL